MSFKLDDADPVRRVLFSSPKTPATRSSSSRSSSSAPSIAPRVSKHDSDLIDGENSELDEDIDQDDVDVSYAGVIDADGDEDGDDSDEEENSFLDDEAEEASELDEEPEEEAGFNPFPTRPTHVVDTTDDEEGSDDEEDAGSLKDFVDDSDVDDDQADRSNIEIPESPEVDHAEELEKELEDLRDSGDEVPRRRKLVRKNNNLIPSSPIESSPERPAEEINLGSSRKTRPKEVVSGSPLESNGGIRTTNPSAHSAPMRSENQAHMDPGDSYLSPDEADATMRSVSPEPVPIAVEPCVATKPSQDNRKRKRESMESDMGDSVRGYDTVEQPQTKRQKKKRGKQSMEKRRQSLNKIIPTVGSTLTEEQKRQRREEKKLRRKNKEARQLAKLKKKEQRMGGAALQERIDSHRGQALRTRTEGDMGSEHGELQLKGQPELDVNAETYEVTLPPALEGVSEKTSHPADEETHSVEADRSSRTIEDTNAPTTSTPALLSPFRSESSVSQETSIFPDAPPSPAEYASSCERSPGPSTTQISSTSSKPTPKKKNLRQPSKSPYFSTGPEAQEGRIPRGASVMPWPSKDAERFGLIQEEFMDQPFFVILVTIFLSKTKGTNAIPVFRKFIKAYPTPQTIVEAPVEDIETYFVTLGLPGRAKQIKNLAATWVQQPPVAGVVSKFSYKYPNPASTLPFPEELFDEPFGVPIGTEFEIGHLKGFGLYGMDSWRIFCRDALLGKENEEWMHVVPNDKELRSYIRWRWNRVGKYWREEFDDWIPDIGVSRLKKPLYPSQVRARQELTGRKQKLASKNMQVDENGEAVEVASPPVRRTRGKKAAAAVEPEPVEADEESTEPALAPVRRTRRKAGVEASPEAQEQSTETSSAPARRTRKKVPAEAPQAHELTKEAATKEPEVPARRTRKKVATEPVAEAASEESQEKPEVEMAAPTPARRTRKKALEEVAPTPLRRSRRVAAKE